MRTPGVEPGWVSPQDPKFKNTGRYTGQRQTMCALPLSGWYASLVSPVVPGCLLFRHRSVTGPAQVRCASDREPAARPSGPVSLETIRPPRTPGGRSVGSGSSQNPSFLKTNRPALISLSKACRSTPGARTSAICA